MSAMALGLTPVVRFWAGNFVGPGCYTITIDLFKGLKKIVSIGNLVDSPTRRVGESFFDYEYLREFEAKIGIARNFE